AILTWRHRSGARPEDEAGSDRPLAWVATTAGGGPVGGALGDPARAALRSASPGCARWSSWAGWWWPRGSTGAPGTPSRATTAWASWWPRSRPRSPGARRATPADPTTGPRRVAPAAT